jgi:hypothetical protein
MSARRASECPQCRNEIGLGDEIGQPEVPNGDGGNLYAAAWYCRPCADDLQELGPGGGRFWTAEEMEADHARRSPILERIAARRG